MPKTTCPLSASDEVFARAALSGGSSLSAPDAHRLGNLALRYGPHSFAASGWRVLRPPGEINLAFREGLSRTAQQLSDAGVRTRAFSAHLLLSGELFDNSRVVSYKTRLPCAVLKELSAVFVVFLAMCTFNISHAFVLFVQAIWNSIIMTCATNASRNFGMLSKN